MDFPCRQVAAPARARAQRAPGLQGDPVPSALRGRRGCPLWPRVSREHGRFYQQKHGHFLGFHGISMGFYGILWDFYGISWDFRGFHGISWDFKGFGHENLCFCWT